MPKEFEKDDMNYYLLELAREFKRLTHRKAEAEIVLVGGASIVLNYGFRNTTTDFDALIQAPTAIRDAVNNVRDRLDLPMGWINEDFKITASYTPKLYKYSSYYRTYANVMTVRTIVGQYLVAMKLRSGRKYKHDLSDIVGILMTHRMEGNPLLPDDIREAYEQLYGDWNELPEDSRLFVNGLAEDEQLAERYVETIEAERGIKETVIDFEQKYPDTINLANEDEIINMLTNRNKSGNNKNGENEDGVL